MSDAPLERSGDIARLPGTNAELESRAESYFRSARAPNTVKAYRHDLEDFATWCKVDAGDLSPMPAAPRTVALYVTDAAGRGLKAATIQRRLAAIAQLHQEAGFDDPTKTKTVRNTFRGIVREIGSFQEGKAPLLPPTLRRVLRAFEGERSPAATRDRALLLVGLAGGYRVSELASLRTENVEMVDEGAIVLLRSSKTDQAAGGLYKGIPYGDHPETCPVSHLRAWLELLPTPPKDDPVFRSIDRHGNIGNRPMAPDSVSRVVKKRAQMAGLDPSRYSGHSLRAGLVTAASEGGAHDKDIMRQTAHRSLSTLHRYRRTVGLFKNNPASFLGL
ncbi:MAG: tyrosine-type recombinase/integrase [Actinomycetota bacterium]|nr:tyrosine-type recombinase/integrase [Rubrobacter sp.]MDQ3506703.1 tyrosine-type recombinase/integrase [Actinomycetota bacterium]